MTVGAIAVPDIAPSARSDRYQLSRAGILNVWQYDDQEFEFAGGRLLLRGTNGAGKSKTLEMLLPFVLDGDKARLTSSARHHTSLLWLMTDGYEGQARVGYLWVEFARPGGEQTFTCGVGIRASASARTAVAWFFTTTLRVGRDLALEDDAGPLSKQRLAERLGSDGHLFEQARSYKEHVGRALFGLPGAQYDEVLRLLYWLRQPQVGEDIEPKRLGEQLLQALPQLDEQAVRAAGETFDELADFGDQLDRRSAAAEALATLSEAYAGYARATVRGRAAAVVTALKEETRRTGELRRRQRDLAAATTERDTADQEAVALRNEIGQNRERIRELDASPEARDQQRLSQLSDRVAELTDVADRAAGAADRAAEQLSRRQRRVANVAEHLVKRLRMLGDGLLQRDRAMRESGVPANLALPAAASVDSLSDGAHGARLTQALVALGTDLDTAGRAVGRRQAAVRVVTEAVEVHLSARRECALDEERAADAEQRWEEARRAHAEAEANATTAVDDLSARLRAWQSEPAAPPLDVPAELTRNLLENLGAAARTAAAAPLADLRAHQQSAASARDRAATELSELREKRAEIEREPDPAPPEPVLGRTDRVDGAALWRLVDFRDGLSGDERAGLEAALQSSGLLDAWVRPDGVILDAEQRDTVLPLGPAHASDTLLDVLRPDSPPGCDVGVDVVTTVLSRIGQVAAAADRADPAETDPWVGLDGSWALGPLRGRAGKPRAQFVGATARAAERRRRLADVDAAIERVRTRHDEAATTVTELSERIGRLETWRDTVPAVQPVLSAWTAVDVQVSIVAREHAAHESAQARVLSARQRVARLLRELHQVSRQHGVPDDGEALAALAERLRTIERDVTDLTRAVPLLTDEVRRWAEERTEVDTEAEGAVAARDEALSARTRADQVAAALEELRAASGAGVAELQRRLGDLQGTVREGEQRVRALDQRSRDLTGTVGALESELQHARTALADQAELRVAALEHLAAVTDVPGMLESAYAGQDAAPDRARFAQAAGVQAQDPVPAGVQSLAHEIAGFVADAAGDPNAVWRAFNDAASGPAADHEPRVSEFGDLLAVVGRDVGGECAIGELAVRVAAAVEQDRRLLTQRERERFEQHVLGELGDAIRGRRLEADELVEAMNKLLAGVSTSQGIRMKLDWRLRDDVPADARDAIDLLRQPLGALLPEERATLRDALHRLIEASRAESPELSYGEHLAAALDYRSWFEFRIKYTRPESDGKWLELHRRSPLSQGEQKVLCYLPLFAAAAAHFTSLAGAAPYAPRLVLLDDAFPKIDVRTHPLLFGLLVQLDLDFVITSERLWGDHDTVPSLAIYEALRDPSERGIAQYQYRWDGRALRAIG